MKPLKYSKSLVTFLSAFTNKNEKETKSEKYLFTKGIIYTSHSLIATNRRLLVEVETEGIPQEMMGKSYDVEGNLITDKVDMICLQMLTMKRRPEVYCFDVDKWDKMYDKIKKFKRPKDATKIAPGECVNFDGKLIVRADYFDNVARVCKKYGINQINYSADSYIIKSESVQIIGVVYNDVYFDTKQVPEYKKL